MRGNMTLLEIRATASQILVRSEDRSGQLQAMLSVIDDKASLTDDLLNFITSERNRIGKENEMDTALLEELKCSYAVLQGK
jgi:hypothetical protein